MHCDVELRRRIHAAFGQLLLHFNQVAELLFVQFGLVLGILEVEVQEEVAVGLSQHGVAAVDAIDLL